MLLFQDSTSSGSFLLSVLVLWAFLPWTHLQLALEVLGGPVLHWAAFASFSLQPHRLFEVRVRASVIHIVSTVGETCHFPGWVPGTSCQASYFTPFPFMAKDLGLREVVSLVKSPAAGTGQRQDSNPGRTPKGVNDKDKCVTCTC